MPYKKSTRRKKTENRSAPSGMNNYAMMVHNSIKLMNNVTITASRLHIELEKAYRNDDIDKVEKLTKVINATAKVYSMCAGVHRSANPYVGSIDIEE